MEPCIKCPKKSSEVQDIIEIAKEWAIMNGLSKLATDTCNGKFVVEAAAFSLLPSSIPRAVYLEACELQPIFNELIHKIAHDYNFLREALKETIRIDPFMRKLFNLHETVIKEGCVQDISLGLFRSDFLVDKFDSFKQVETNAESGGFWLAPQTTKLHKFILKEMGADDNQMSNIPENNVFEEFAKAIVQAWNMYEGERDAILVLASTQAPNRYFEDRAIEFEIKKLCPGIRVLLKSLTQLANTAKLGINKELIVDGKIIAVVFYYDSLKPSMYASEAEWNTRLLMELSKAIKCPTIQYQLAASKKVQQVLCQPGVVESFLQRSGNEVSRVRRTFTRLYSLDFTEEGNKAAEMAMKNPEKFVLKFDRDGGGNNVFGAEIKNKLEILEMNKERPGWILMEKIPSVSHVNYFIKSQNNSSCEPIELACELSTFGVIIGDSKKIFVNKQVGTWGRTKSSHSNEAGIRAGYGASSSIYLV